MLTADEARSGFGRQQAAKLECPLCSADDVGYEFVLERVAFSLCQGCGLLFGNRLRLANARTTSDPNDGAAIEALIPVVAKYARHVPERCVLIGSMEAHVAGLEVRELGSLASGELFDAIFLLRTLEGEANPAELLCDLSKHLSLNGTLVLLAPSTASAAARSQRNAWGALRSGRYFFSPDNLQLLATRCELGEFISFIDAQDLGCGSNEGLERWFRSNMALLCRPVRRNSPRLLSVIFPVFNEVATVETSLIRVLNKEIPDVDIEVVIVESNSTDGSRAIVEKYRDHDRVRLVLEDRPRGKGFAVRIGLQHARGDVILFQDADLEYDVEDYDELVSPLFELRRNFILGSRHNARGEAWKIRHFAEQPGVSTLANMAHVVLLKMFNTIYKQRLRDPFTMYKVFRRDCLYGLTFECNRFDFDFEINIKLLRKGYQPTEIPVNYNSRSFTEGKKVSFFADPPTWVRAMVKLRRTVLYRHIV